jgi:hypothetical protein
MESMSIKRALAPAFCVLLGAAACGIPGDSGPRTIDSVSVTTGNKIAVEQHDNLQLLFTADGSVTVRGPKDDEQPHGPILGNFFCAQQRLDANVSMPENAPSYLRQEFKHWRRQLPAELCADKTITPEEL